MRDIGYFERELIRIRRENANNANTVEALRQQILELQEHINRLLQLIAQETKIEKTDD
jgi:TolA-binding protein